MSKFTVIPMSLAEANAIVTALHRHSGATQGGKFAIGCALDDVLWGVAIVGRPVAQGLQDGVTLELLRNCTAPGAPMGVASFLYARAWRACQQLGYRRMVSYTLQSENGGSLRGAGMRIAGEVSGGRQWNSKSRPRLEKDIYAQAKFRWEISA
jgi:hypothetical protein